MARDRAFNRFHRYLARQKRRGLRSVLPQFSSDQATPESARDHSRNSRERISTREMRLDLIEADA